MDSNITVPYQPGTRRVAFERDCGLAPAPKRGRGWATDPHETGSHRARRTGDLNVGASGPLRFSWALGITGPVASDRSVATGGNPRTVDAEQLTRCGGPSSWGALAVFAPRNVALGN